ncbi:MAG TPA: hypothetical protein VF283_11675 [Bryobacteraceae bacterium]
MTTPAAADAPSAIVSKFIALWNYPILRSPIGLAVLIAIVVAICGCRAWIGLAGMQEYCHDAFMMLDGAWRMLNGQRPHIDFFTNVGMLAYAPTAVGLWMAHNHAQGFGYGQALAGFLLAAWAYFLGRKRLSGLPLALFCIAIAFVATAPSALGFSPLRTAPGMTYNRYAYALLALLLLEAIGWRDLSNRARFWGGISTGAVIAILLFLKISAFACAIFLLVALIPCQRQTTHRWAGLVAGFAACLAAFCAYVGFDMRPMIHDLRILAGARHFWFAYRVDAIFQSAILLCAFAIAAALLLYARNDRRGFRSIAVAGIAVSIAGALLILGNYELAGCPLAIFLAILVIERVNARPIGRPHPFGLFHASILLLGSAFIIGSLASGAMAASNGLYRALWKARFAPEMHSRLLSGFVPVGPDQPYTNFVNDGLGLVKKYRRPGDTVMSLDFTNPFSYGLAMPPAPGGATVLQYGSTFDNVHRLSAERLFGKADFVMLPKNFSDPTLKDTIGRIYGLYLESHFTKLGESRFWSIFRKKEDVTN